MKKYLIDTNVISELRKRGGRADQNVVSWFHARDYNLYYISVITLFELELGVLQKARIDPAQGKLLRKWLDNLRDKVFQGRILPITSTTAMINASLNVPDRHQSADSRIAATAIENRMALVTRNVKDFHNIPVEIINPWDGNEC